MRLQSFQDDIGRDLEDDVWHEKDGQSGVVLGAGQIEVLLQLKNHGIGNVGAIEEGQKVEDAQHRNDADIDSGEELALGGVGRTWYLHVVGVVKVWTLRIGIVVVVACWMIGGVR